MSKQGEVVRNKARILWKGYSQEEGIDYEERYAHIARMKVVRMFLAYATSKNFKVYQMDVKSSFWNAELKEELYIEKSNRFPLT